MTLDCGTGRGKPVKAAAVEPCGFDLVFAHIDLLSLPHLRREIGDSALALNRQTTDQARIGIEKSAWHQISGRTRVRIDQLSR